MGFDEERVPARAAGAWVLTDVALVVEKGDLDPDAVTARLGLQPTAVRFPGVDRWGPPGDVAGRWRLTCDERTTRDLSGQLEHVLSAAEGCAVPLREMRAEGCDVRLAVYGFAGHGSHLLIPAPMISRVARLGLPLILTPNMNDR
ncbi:DUF4279 domain-containing protein [Streptomyces sp. NPDC001586]|uniref:DUF4279 domain-containing protein n=1 Tax=Streptomyces sp. NPDC001586 TaxID=3154387 RepID=UPI00332AE820